jgi:hypothetical protein
LHGHEADLHDDGEEGDPPSDNKADVKDGHPPSPSGGLKRKAASSANADDSPKKTKSKKANK